MVNVYNLINDTLAMQRS